MAGNTNFDTQGPQYSAFGIEQQISRDWEDNVTKKMPLLAMIHEGKTNWRKNAEVKNGKLLLPVVYSDIPGFNTSTAGVASTNEIPTSWPNFDDTEGFTHAEYTVAHLRRGMTLKATEKMWASPGPRGNLLEQKAIQLMTKFKSVVADMVTGNQADSETTLLGTQFALSTSNTVGGIDQSLASNDWWRASTSTGIGVLSLSDVDDLYDEITVEGVDDALPDLLLLGHSDTVNVFGAMRSLIAPAERFENSDFKVKYGIANYEYIGLRCVKENRIASGTAQMLTSKKWYYAGNKSPQKVGVDRIPGSDAFEHMYNMFCAIGTNSVRRNGLLSGITG